MDTYPSMKKQLLSTGLYTLGGSTAVDFELKAYAEGLNAAYTVLNELQKECFISTASGYGLTIRESDFGLSGSGKTIKQRRAALLALGSVTQSDFTKSDLESLLSALGLSLTLEEDTADQKLTAHFLTEPACGRDTAQKLLEKFLPAHLSFVPDYSGLS